MIGAIAGDIIGSIYEARGIKTKDFPMFGERCRFTDDTVLTVAVAEAILTNTSYLEAIRRIGRRYPYAGYGGSFIHWLQSDDPQPYNSWGNGSAMRASPIGFAFASEEEVLHQARLSAEISHNHPEGIKGAQAAAFAVYLARTGSDREVIRSSLAERFGYNLNRSVEQIRPEYSFDISCQGSVPEAIISFLDSQSWEDAVRNAVSLGGDADTLACIAGAVAEAHYGSIPEEIQRQAEELLPPYLLRITRSFCDKYR